jgi:aminoglycoside 2'-N-acetyltransferase I
VVRLDLCDSDELSPHEQAALRHLLDVAFDGEFADTDWESSLGGTHVLARDGALIVGHAAVVRRTLEIAGQPFATGYVEAVAVAPGRQRNGVGSAVMGAVDRIIRSRHDLGALGTGEWAFYERLGWERWQGPSGVRFDGEVHLTPTDDDGLMVLRHGPSATIDLTALITCPWRPGDVW